MAGFCEDWFCSAPILFVAFVGVTGMLCAVSVPRHKQGCHSWTTRRRPEQDWQRGPQRTFPGWAFRPFSSPTEELPPVQKAVCQRRPACLRFPCSLCSGQQVSTMNKSRSHSCTQTRTLVPLDPGSSTPFQTLLGHHLHLQALTKSVPRGGPAPPY